MSHNYYKNISEQSSGFGKINERRSSLKPQQQRKPSHRKSVGFSNVDVRLFGTKPNDAIDIGSVPLPSDEAHTGSANRMLKSPVSRRHSTSYEANQEQDSNGVLRRDHAMETNGNSTPGRVKTSDDGMLFSPIRDFNAMANSTTKSPGEDFSMPALPDFVTSQMDAEFTDDICSKKESASAEVQVQIDQVNINEPSPSNENSQTTQSQPAKRKGLQIRTANSGNVITESTEKPLHAGKGTEKLSKSVNGPSKTPSIKDMALENMSANASVSSFAKNQTVQTVAAVAVVPRQSMDNSAIFGLDHAPHYLMSTHDENVEYPMPFVTHENSSEIAISPRTFKRNSNALPSIPFTETSLARHCKESGLKMGGAKSPAKTIIQREGISPKIYLKPRTPLSVITSKKELVLRAQSTEAEAKDMQSVPVGHSVDEIQNEGIPLEANTAVQVSKAQHPELIATSAVLFKSLSLEKDVDRPDVAVGVSFSPASKGSDWSQRAKFLESPSLTPLSPATLAIVQKEESLSTSNSCPNLKNLLFALHSPAAPRNHASLKSIIRPKVPNVDRQTKDRMLEFETSPAMARIAAPIAPAHSLSSGNDLFNTVGNEESGVDLDSETVGEPNKIAESITQEMRQRAQLESQLKHQEGELVSPQHPSSYPNIVKESKLGLGKTRERQLSEKTQKSLNGMSVSGRPHVYVTHLPNRATEPIGTICSDAEEDDIVTKAESDAETEFDDLTSCYSQEEVCSKRVKIDAEEISKQVQEFDVPIFIADKGTENNTESANLGINRSSEENVKVDMLIPTNNDDRPAVEEPKPLTSPSRRSPRKGMLKEGEEIELKDLSSPTPRKSLLRRSSRLNPEMESIQASHGNPDFPEVGAGNISTKEANDRSDMCIEGDKISESEESSACDEVSKTEIVDSESDDDMQFTSVLPSVGIFETVLKAGNEQSSLASNIPVESHSLSNQEGSECSDMECATTAFNVRISVQNTEIEQEIEADKEEPAQNYESPEKPCADDDVTRFSISSLSTGDSDATASMEFTVAMKGTIHIANEALNVHTSPPLPIDNENKEDGIQEPHPFSSSSDEADDDMVMTAVITSTVKKELASHRESLAEGGNSENVDDAISTTLEIDNDDMEFTQVHSAMPVLETTVADIQFNSQPGPNVPQFEQTHETSQDDMEETAVLPVRVQVSENQAVEAPQSQLTRPSALVSPTHLRGRNSTTKSTPTEVEVGEEENADIASTYAPPDDISTVQDDQNLQEMLKESDGTSTIGDATAFSVLNTFIPQNQTTSLTERQPSQGSNATNSSISTQQLLEYVQGLDGVDLDAVSGIGNETRSLLRDVQLNNGGAGTVRRRSRKSSFTGFDDMDDSLASTVEGTLDMNSTYRGRTIKAIPEHGVQGDENEEENDDDEGNGYGDEGLDESFTLAPNGDLIAKFKSSKKANSEGKKANIAAKRTTQLNEDDDDSILGEETQAFVRKAAELHPPFESDYSASAIDSMMSTKDQDQTDPSNFSLFDSTDQTLSISSPNHRLGKRDRRSSILSPMGSPNFGTPNSHATNVSQMGSPAVVNTLRALMTLANVPFDASGNSGNEAKNSGNRRDSEFGLAGRLQRLSKLFKRSNEVDSDVESINDENPEADIHDETRKALKAGLALDDSGKTISIEELYTSCVDAVEMDAYAQGCVQLMGLNEESSASVEKLAAFVDRVAPKPFSELILRAKKSSEDRKEVQRALRQAHLYSRLAASKAWYLWRGDLLAETQSSVATHANSLRDDAQVARSFAQQLRTLRAAEVANADPELQELRAAVAEHADVVHGSVQEREELRQTVSEKTDQLGMLETQLQDLVIQVETETEQAVVTMNGDIAQAKVACNTAEANFAWTRSLGGWNVVQRVAVSTNSEGELIPGGSGIDLALKPAGSLCSFQLIAQWSTPEGKLFGLPELYLHVSDNALTWPSAEKNSSHANQAACALSSLTSAGGSLNGVPQSAEEMRIMMGFGVSASSWLAQKRAHVELVRAMYITAKPSLYEVLNRCRSQSSIAACATQLALRLQHMTDIGIELEQIVASGRAHVLVETPKLISPANQNTSLPGSQSSSMSKYAPAAITLTVTSEQRVQFNIRLEIPESYPRCDFESSARVEVLGVPPGSHGRGHTKRLRSQILSVLREQKGYGRLGKVCDALHTLIQNAAQ